ncbi:hypothetical protein [Corallococcus aberystwythensis]|uniref:DUF4382 domain-containing protein n=1 Tax=Corallococcus aberystwythensis TaxID=2316722 RepID=A0A3A8QHP8_9BACT|nr:hypothetical protein [Corallococcus aberystwythensis]RKH68233.1 hypothetical protein D7W81_12735 [Corallococcus aberystwythensis]
MNQRSKWIRGLLVGALGLVASGCGDAVARGDVRVTLSGGDGTQRGYADHLFQDGWSVQFTKYLVSLGDFTLTSAAGDVRATSEHRVVDVQKGDVPLTGLEGLEAGRYGVAFRVSPPEARTVAGASVSADDLAMMRERGFSYFVEGRAQNRDPALGLYTFRMGFPVNARMVDCINGVDGTQGIVVPEGSVAEAEVTIHAEHMFYDRLGTHRGVQLRFEAIAATADTHHAITPEGLASQDLLDLRGLDGGELRDAQGQPVVYQPGAYALRTLQEFVTQSIVDQAHLNGGGVCTVAAP